MTDSFRPGIDSFQNVSRVGPKPIDRALIVGRRRRTSGTVFFGRAVLAPKGPAERTGTYSFQALDAAVNASRTRVPKPHLARPIVAPKGGYPTVVPGTFVGLGPSERIRRRRFLYQTITAPPIVTPKTTFIAPRATIVGNRAIQRSYKLRGVPPFTTTATPIFVAPLARFANLVSLGAAERNRRRRFPGNVLVAPPIVAPAFIAPRAKIVSTPFLRRGRRNVPPSTILPAPTFVAPIARFATIATIEGVERVRRRRFLAGTILPPAIVGLQPVRPGTFVFQAVKRLGARRGRTLLAPPVVGQAVFAPVARGTFVYQAKSRAASGPVVATLRTVWAPAPPVVARGTFSYQAAKRAYVGRTPPHSHLASPVVTPTLTFVAPAALVVSQAIRRASLRRSGTVRLPSAGSAPPVSRGTFVSQALRRPYVSRQAAKTLRAAPLVASAVGFRSAAFLFLQAIPRAQERRFRDVAPAPHLALRVQASAGPGATIVGQARRRPYVGRTVPKPHLAAAVAATAFVAPAPVVVSQSVRRTLTRRTVPAPHLPALGSSPSVARLVVVEQAIGRARLGRGPNPRPKLAGPIVSPVGVFPPNAPGKVYSVALSRSTERRFRDVVPAPHLPPPVHASAGPGATIKLQALARQLRRREGRVLLPRLGTQPPVARGTFASQALRRALLGRGPNPRPRLAAPIVAVPGVFPPNPPGTFVSQARARAAYSPAVATLRTVWAPSPPVVPSGTFASQAIRRPYVGRSVPRPHLVAGIVGPRVFPPNAPGTFVGQSQRRPFIGRTVPRPHLAKPVVRRAPVPPGTFISQATQRGSSLISRRGRVRLAPVIVPRRPRPTPVIVSQALQRPYVGRRIVPAHLAPPVGTKAGPGAHLYSQALQRALIGRTVPLRPRLAPPIVPPPPPPTAPVKTTGTTILQAVERAYLGRKVPPSPSLRYRPIVLTPSQPPVPFPPITGTGGTSPGRSTGETLPHSGGGETAPSSDGGETAPRRPSGTTAPSQRSGQTAPYRPGGTTQPSERGGTTAPKRSGGSTNPSSPSGTTSPQPKQP